MNERISTRSTLISSFTRRFAITVCAAAVLIGATATSGCTFETAPIYNVRANAPAARPLSGEEVRTGIYRALTVKNWVVTAEEPWNITAMVTAGGHSAVVAIAYNTEAYTITRVDSSAGLKYDPSHPRHGEIIHRRYNHWINLLNQQIQREISALIQPAVPPPPVS